jgi:hypothetical protein
MAYFRQTNASYSHLEKVLGIEEYALSIKINN